MGMLKPDKFKVDLVDYDNEVGLAFSVGEGDERVRWGARLAPKMAAEIAHSLAVACDRIRRKPGDTITFKPPESGD